MLKIKKRKGHGILQDYLFCFGLSALTIILLSLVGAAISLSLNDPTGYIGVVSLSVLLLSAVVSGVTTSFIRNDCSLGFCALVSLGVVLILLLSAVITCGGRVSVGSFMNYGCYFGVYLMSFFISKSQKGRRKHRHR